MAFCGAPPSSYPSRARGLDTPMCKTPLAFAALSPKRQGHRPRSREADDLYKRDEDFAGKVVWGSRYPHHDATSARDALTRLRGANVPEPLIARMMGGNAARQFAIEPLREPAA
jgi:hypothetical protein